MTDEARSYLDFFGHLSCKLLLFVVINLCIFVFILVSFRIYNFYNFKDNQMKKQKNKKKNKKINRRLNRWLAPPSRCFNWRYCHPPPNPDLLPLLQICHPVLQRQVLTATVRGGRSLPPLETAAGAGGLRLFVQMLNLTIYFHKIKNIKKMGKERVVRPNEQRVCLFSTQCVE
jgi:hypothetical protein